MGHEKKIVTILLIFIQSVVVSQTILLNGLVRDERTLKPLPDVNIKVHGTVSGTSTDNIGRFSLRLNKIPASLVITCVGYEEAYAEITGIHQDTVDFFLVPRSYDLREVDISSKKYSFLFKNKDYSVLDYELMNDNILLLIFRYQLKRSELILLNRSGDTLAISKLPEIPPASLFKDFLENVHYFTRASTSYQCFYNSEHNRIELMHKTTVDSLNRLLRPFIFKMSDRLYFQENLANGFGTAIGFYEHGAGKKYILKQFNEKKMSEYFDDQTYYQKWNGNLPVQHYFMESRVDEFYTTANFDFTKGESPGQFFEINEARANQFEFYNLVYPVIKTGENSIAVFDFANDMLEFINKDGETLKTVPITFHKESASSGNLVNANWRWSNIILVDEYTRDAFTVFHRNGMVKIRKIDFETGKLSIGTVLPFPFPEKIEIYKGDSYFLIKSDGANDKWKLARCKL
jgi:hypothetical protein